jgi:hypothetical protein
MRAALAVVATGGALLAATAAAEGPPVPSVSAHAVIAELARNQRELRSYRWISRVSLDFSGERVGVRTSDARFGEDGAIVRTPVAATEPAAGDRPRRHRKRDERVAAVAGEVEALTDEYLASALDGRPSAFAGARVTEGGAQGRTLLQARDVLRRGDTLKIQVDARTLRPRQLDVVTSLAGEPVSIRVEFADLDGGPSHPARLVVETEIKEDVLTVTTENTIQAPTAPGPD